MMLKVTVSDQSVFIENVTLFLEFFFLFYFLKFFLSRQNKMLLFFLILLMKFVCCLQIILNKVQYYSPVLKYKEINDAIFIF